MGYLSLNSDYFYIQVRGKYKKCWMRFSCEVNYQFDVYYCLMSISMQNETGRCYKKMQSFLVPKEELRFEFEHLLIELERAWWNFMKRRRKPSFNRIKDKLFRRLSKRKVENVVIKKDFAKIRAHYCGIYDISYHMKAKTLYGHISRNKVKLNFEILDFSL